MLASLLLLGAQPLAAQWGAPAGGVEATRAPRLAPGVLVRVTLVPLAPADAGASAGRRHVGRLAALDGDALRFTPETGAAPVALPLALPLSDVQRLEVGTHSRGQRVVTGMLIGAAAGALFAEWRHRCGGGGICSDIGAIRMLVGATAGGTLGAVGGTLAGPKRRWHTVPVPGAPGP